MLTVLIVLIMALQVRANIYAERTFCDANTFPCLLGNVCCRFFDDKGTQVSSKSNGFCVKTANKELKKWSDSNGKSYTFDCEAKSINIGPPKT